MTIIKHWVISCNIILVRPDHQDPNLLSDKFNLNIYPPNPSLKSLREGNISRNSKASINWLLLGWLLIEKAHINFLLLECFCSKPQNPSWSSKIDMSFLNKQSPKKQPIDRCFAAPVLSCFYNWIRTSIDQWWTRQSENRTRILLNVWDIEEKRLKRLVLKIRS